MKYSPSELKQLEMLRTKTPAQRFLMMTELIGAQLEAMKAGIRFNNPGMSEKELDKCLKSRIRQIYSLADKKPSGPPLQKGDKGGFRNTNRRHSGTRLPC